MCGLNHHSVDNGDVEVYPSDYPSKYTSSSLPDPDNTPICSATSYQFGFVSLRNGTPLNMLKLLVNTLRNEYEKVDIVGVDFRWHTCNIFQIHVNFP